MDEFGSFLRRIKDGPYGNVSEITGEMRKLWDPWRPYNSIKKARQDSITVEAPALSVLALATPADFYSALVVEDVSNGFLNRFLILEEKVRPSEQDPNSWVNDVPLKLMEKTQRVWSHAGRPAIDGKPSVVLNWGPGAKAVYDEFNTAVQSETDERIVQLRIRAPEMAVRLASIRAGGRQSASVDKVDMEWGRDLAVASADMLVAGVREHMVPPGLDGLCEKITDFLGRHGGSASQRNVFRSVRRAVKRPNDLADAFHYLEVEERIKIEEPKDGRSGRILHLLKD